MLVVFDVLRADGADVRSLALAQRRERLCEHHESNRRIHVIQSILTFGEALFAAIVEQDHEHVLAKRLEPPHHAARQSL